MLRRFAVVFGCCLALSACASEKLNAEETAAELDRTYPSESSWRCIEADAGWDYVCGGAALSDIQLRRQGIGVAVDADSVVERAAP